MALLSSLHVLYFRIAVLLTIAFFCYKDVTSILTNSYYLVLTNALNLPELTLARYSAQLGMFSILFLLLALADLIPLLENNMMYFYSIVPVRLSIFFILGAWSYLSEKNYFIHNNAVFIYSFVEVWMNFLIYSAIRDERNENFRVTHQFIQEVPDEE